METFGEIELTTADEGLWEQLFDLQLHGVKVTHKLEKGFKGDKLVRKVIVHFLLPTAVGCFSSWLYEHCIRRSESETQIEGQSIPKERTQITNIIMEQITINNSYRIERPERERVPEE